MPPLQGRLRSRARARRARLRPTKTASRGPDADGADGPTAVLLFGVADLGFCPAWRLLCRAGRGPM
eukprot:14336211-Alexandrium_andersonii.AAC.1